MWNVKNLLPDLRQPDLSYSRTCHRANWDSRWRHLNSVTTAQCTLHLHVIALARDGPTLFTFSHSVHFGNWFFVVTKWCMSSPWLCCMTFSVSVCRKTTWWNEKSMTWILHLTNSLRDTTNSKRFVAHALCRIDDEHRHTQDFYTGGFHRGWIMNFPSQRVWGW